MAATTSTFLTRNRGMIIFLFAVPFSFLYNKKEQIQSWIYRTFFASPKKHDQRVANISHLVKSAAKSGKKLVTARPTWKTMSNRKSNFKDDCVQIPLNLKDILHLDKENLTITVEPMVTMADITRFLVPKGYALAVQVEMDDLTVGGLCMGVGIETSSHRYGFLFETISAYEIVTATGEIIKATADNHAELFHTLPWSHGTLGFLVGVTLQIIPIKKYVKVDYLPFHNLKELTQEFEALSKAKDGPTYLEGLMFSEQEGVIMCGNFDDGKNRSNTNYINRSYKRWFYEYVGEFLNKGKGTDWIPARHYFHRHTPSVFFQLKDLIPFANKAWYRYLFAWLGAPKVSLMKFSMTKELRKRAFANRVAQDILVPIPNMEEGISMIHQDYNIYPLWLCPVRIYDKKECSSLIPRPQNCNKDGYEMYIDVGIYGIPAGVGSKDGWDSVYHGRKLEHYNISKGGFQMLYADIFMTKKEFETMFPHSLYRKVRADYGADKIFPEVYEKVIPEKWLANLDELAEKYPHSKEAKKEIEQEKVVA